MIELFSKDANGNIRTWKALVHEDGFTIETGVVGGSVQSNFTSVPFGLAGRTNEQQIESMIHSKAKKLIDRGFVYSHAAAMASQQANGLGWHKQMLAQRWSKMSKKMDWKENYVQRKYNGFRCTIRGFDGAMYTRGAQLIETYPELLESIPNTDGIPLDGELYCHGFKLQTISSWIRKRQPETLKLKFMCYDAIIEGAPFSERIKFIQSLKFGPRVEVAPTAMLIGQFNPIPIMEGYVAEGYEGAMIRVGSSLYESGKRSKGLIKVKPLIDKEFLVVNILPSVDGWARLVLKVKDGVYFNASAPGTVEEKTEVLKNKNFYIGKMINVEFPEYSADGIPTQAVATLNKGWIDPEDLIE